MIEEILNWLRQFPELAGLAAENLGTAVGCCGLFPQGEQVTGQYADLLGNETLSCRRSFLLRLRAVPRTETALGLEALQQWVQDQSHIGALPQLGEDTRAETKNARLLSRDQTGTAVYELQLIFTYTKQQMSE